jgi:cold-inducible RNA-binding protein
MTIFVANFDNETDESDLQTLFENFGTVEDVYIMTDRRTGDQLGYGFVEMPNDREAEEAIAKLDGRRWNGRRLKVNQKRSR